ncbi:hypothetical protein P3X46_026456 [Hevea brasiliensis]|uniref:Peroxidase n=1 Tax=Hevea brasiliensis TaxID=3981 RepID=A0ABQ9KWZ9_HEVBR|nr:hypothetical protein P3X46_026456 [Hevea brasiliensis]
MAIQVLNILASPAKAAALMFVVLLLNTACQAQLTSTFYQNSCPNALSTIRTSIRNSIAGCDASILLDETSSIESEKTALPNKDSARGFQVIEKAKTEVEKICPGIVSCADIIAVAARDASAYVGGPSWTVMLGRRDSTTASRTLANSELPSFKDGLDRLISRFQSSHTLGQAQCVTFRDRIYSNSTDIDAGFASTRKRSCPSAGGDSNLAPLDLVTPNSYDNNYFKNLIQKKGLLESDQILFSGGSTDSIVSEYSRSPATFNSDFASAMIKMGNINPLTGTAGEIRKICSAVN